MKAGKPSHDMIFQSAKDMLVATEPSPAIQQTPTVCENWRQTRELQTCNDVVQTIGHILIVR